MRCLRDSGLVEVVVHVDTHDNLADLFTKALPIQTFTALPHDGLPPHSSMRWCGGSLFSLARKHLG